MGLNIKQQGATTPACSSTSASPRIQLCSEGMWRGHPLYILHYNDVIHFDPPCAFRSTSWVVWKMSSCFPFVFPRPPPPSHSREAGLIPVLSQEKELANGERSMSLLPDLALGSHIRGRRAKVRGGRRPAHGRRPPRPVNSAIETGRGEGAVAGFGVVCFRSYLWSGEPRGWRREK